MNLLHGDCLELMRDIPDKSVDMILCDLPYGTTACKWDVVIPFALLWEQYKRVIKDRGAIVLFGSQPFTSALVMSNIEQYKYDWIWNKSKGVGFLNAKNAPLKFHEIISVFSTGNTANNNKNRMCYFPQGLVESCRLRTYSEKDSQSVVGVRPSRKKTNYTQNKSGYPKSTLNYRNERNIFHPTQKPVALLEYLIKTYTLEGETVLDNCMGSGSTGVACVNTNRQFVGIEKDDKYFEIAKQRIEALL